MKNFLTILKIAGFAGCIALIASGCMKDKVTRTYSISTPVYEVLTKFREGIKSQPARAIEAAGKITVQGKYIFLAEPQKGVHVIDNSDPSNPKNVSFINIPGNEDIAIKGDVLYADAYGDLVTLDIHNPLDAIAKNFSANVFPDRAGFYYTTGSVNPDSVNVIVGWTTRDTTVDYDPGYPVLYNNCPNCLTASVSAAAAATKTATNGSTARFSIINNFLYTVGYSDLSSFDIHDPFSPVLRSTLTVDWHVETIFPLKNKLFVGTNNGMYMYDVNETPSKPTFIGALAHTRGCDPVIADGNYAYVTLNDSSACLGFFNQLQIVDIHDLANPFLVKSYDLTHPVGLAKDGDHLFICDGKDGLKVFNAAQVNDLQLIKTLHDDEAYDVIASNGLAIVLSRANIYEYDYTDVANIHRISKL